MAEDIVKLEQMIKELTLKIQMLEQRIVDLEEGNFGTGIYLDGCSEIDAEFISGKTKKVGE